MLRNAGRSRDGQIVQRGRRRNAGASLEGNGDGTGASDKGTPGLVEAGRYGQVGAYGVVKRANPLAEAAGGNAVGGGRDGDGSGVNDDLEFEHVERRVD